MIAPKISKEWKFFFLFSVFTLILRLLTLMEVNTGGDNIDYWYYGKALLNNYPYGDLFHRSIRWGILVPVAFFQMLFGTHAWVIYLIPILMSLILNLVVYKLAKYLFDYKTALLSLAIIQLFPYTIRIGSQLFLAMFSMVYILSSLYFLFKFFDSRGKSANIYLGLSILFMFIAYETKITNLYFLVPWFILIYRRSNIKSLIIYGSVLAALYFVEHICYYRAGFPMGRLGIILNTHFGSGSMTLGEGVQFDGTFLGLFERYSFKNFPIYWHLITWSGIACGIYLNRKGVKKDIIRLLLVVIITFMFILTFAIKSANPFVPMEDFVVRYFSPLLPIFAMLISQVLLKILNLKDNIIIALFALPLIGVFILALALDYLPSSARQYLNNPLKPSQSHLVQTIEFEQEVNRVFNAGGHFATYKDNDVFTLGRRLSHKSLDTVNRLFLHLDKGVGKYGMDVIILESGRELQYLDIPNRTSNTLLLSYRLPFELVETTLDEEK